MIINDITNLEIGDIVIVRDELRHILARVVSNMYEDWGQGNNITVRVESLHYFWCHLTKANPVYLASWAPSNSESTQIEKVKQIDYLEYLV